LNWILHDSFIQLQDENKLLLRDVTDIRLGHTLATSQLLSLCSDYEQLQSKLVTLGEAKTALEGDLVVLRQESGKFEGQVQHLNEEMGTLRVDNLALKEDLCQSGVKYARLAEESKKVVEELRTFRANNFRLKEEVHRTGAKCSQLEADIKTGESMSKAQNNRLGDDLAAARKLLATADQEGQNSMRMLETLKKANLDLNGKNRNLLQRCGRLEKCVSLQINRSAENIELAERLKEDLAREIRVIDQIRDKVAGVVAGEILAIFDDSDHLPRSQCLPKLKEEEKPTVVKESD
jgi:chromosome segregation ATPase